MMLHRSANRSAFTLIELLVVISIVALLVAILLPALGAARDAAESAACLSNVRQLTVTMTNYTADHKGFLVHHRIDPGHADAPADWPALAVESGFAGSEREYYDALHEATLYAARQAVRERERAGDRQLIHAVRAMDDIGPKPT